jgi:hypothetical protein
MAFKRTEIKLIFKLNGLVYNLKLVFIYLQIKKKLKNKTPWPQSASELYRPSDRRLSAKLMPTFKER